MPFDSRLETDWPCFGRYMPKMLSNVRFSAISMITCLIGVAVAGPPELCGLSAMAVPPAAAASKALPSAVVSIKRFRLGEHRVIGQPPLFVQRRHASYAA